VIFNAGVNNGLSASLSCGIVFDLRTLQKLGNRFCARVHLLPIIDGRETSTAITASVHTGSAGRAASYAWRYMAGSDVLGDISDLATIVASSATTSSILLSNRQAIHDGTHSFFLTITNWAGQSANAFWSLQADNSSIVPVLAPSAATLSSTFRRETLEILVRVSAPSNSMYAECGLHDDEQRLEARGRWSQAFSDSPLSPATEPFRSELTDVEAVIANPNLLLLSVPRRSEHPVSKQ